MRHREPVRLSGVAIRSLCLLERDTIPSVYVCQRHTYRDTDCQEVNCPKGKRSHPGVRPFGARNDAFFVRFDVNETASEYAVIRCTPQPSFL